MTHRILRLFACLLIMVSIFSCNVDEVSSTDNFINTSTDQICSETRTGDKGCFEFVFPITIVFSDASTKEVASYEEMKAAFKAWKEANPSVKGRPSIQFPYSVTKDDGTIVTIENAEQMKELVASCKPIKGDGPGHGDGPKGGGPKGDGTPCFTINFPISVTTVSKGVVEITSKEEFKALLKELRKNKEKLELIYPITLTLKDGTVATVNSAEEIKAIKDACRKG
jgi:hypothetical protein